MDNISDNQNLILEQALNEGIISTYGKGHPRITNKDDLLQATIRRTKSHSWKAEIMSKFAITCKWHHFAKQLKDISGKIKMTQTEAPDGTSTIEISDAVRADTGPYR